MAQVDVILLERIERLGQMGDVVAVKPGYARNYLLPQKKALRATEANRRVFEAQRAQLEARNLEQRKEAEQVAKRLDGAKVVLIRQAGESGQLYGSVSARDIAGALTDQGFSVSRDQVAIDKPMKTLGLFPVRIVLHPEVAVEVTVNIARSTDEAEMQEKRGGMITADILEAEERAQEAEDAAKAAEELLEEPSTEDLVAALTEATGGAEEEEQGEADQSGAGEGEEEENKA
jgi:large subunit ribosomal protein L9